jgi:hypothetical protein
MTDLAKEICRMDDPEDKDLTDVEYDEVIRTTAKAALFDIGGDNYWLPCSQIAYLDEAMGEDSTGGTVTIATWLAEKNDLT